MRRTPDERRGERLACSGWLPHANLVSATTGTWAYFHLAGLDWDGRPVKEHDRTILDQAHRWADLAGYRVWLRGMSNPFPVGEFARNLHAEYPTPYDGEVQAREVGAARTFAERMNARRALTVIGVRISARPVATADLPAVLGDEPAAAGVVETARRAYHDVSVAVARRGWAGQPLTAAGLSWVFESSIAPGVPVSHLAVIGDPDPDRHVAHSRPVADPYQLSFPIYSVRDGRPHERHVATLRLKTPNLEVDTGHDRTPWLAWPGTVETPVDWVATFDVREGRALKGAAELRRRVNKNIAEHNEEHGYEPPAEVARGIERSAQIVDEVSNGSREVSTRLVGQVTYTLTAPSKQAVLDAASAFIVEAERDQNMTLVHEWGQYADWRRLIPAEPWILDKGHPQTLSAAYVAAGVPNVTSAAGDSVGMPCGGVAGWSDLYVFDPFGGTKRNRPNVYVAVGEPGSGKTTLLAKVAEWLTVNGVPGVAFDPSGLMTALGDTDNLRGQYRNIALTTADAGILQPHFLVPDPQRRDYLSDRDWVKASAAAEGERKDLAIDAVMTCLPWSMVAQDRDGSILATVEAAAAAVGGAYGTHSRELIDAVRRESEFGERIARALESRAELPDGQLIFPKGDLDPDVMAALTSSAPFTLVTMPGLSLPPKGNTDRSSWTREQHRSVPILMLGSRFAAVPIWANRDRKWFIADELGISTGGAGSFSSFLLRLLYDSRKFNASVGLALQTFGTLSALDENVTSLIGATFLGRTDRDNAAAALPALGLRPGHGWEDSAPSLDDGEFLLSGWDNRVRDVQVDQGWWHPDMVSATDTSPQARGVGASTPFGAW